MCLIDMLKIFFFVYYVTFLFRKSLFDFFKKMGMLSNIRFYLYECHLIIETAGVEEHAIRKYKS